MQRIKDYSMVIPSFLTRVTEREMNHIIEVMKWGQVILLRQYLKEPTEYVVFQVMHIKG